MKLVGPLTSVIPRFNCTGCFTVTDLKKIDISQHMSFEEIRTSFRTVKMTRTVLTDIKVAIITQEGQCKTQKGMTGLNWRALP